MKDGKAGKDGKRGEEGRKICVSIGKRRKGEKREREGRESICKCIYIG